MAPWPGVIEEYRELLPVTDSTPVITLLEGNTPLLDAPRVAQRAGVARVYLKVEGLNPTGSFKDRGMTMAISTAVERDAKVVICASTGNTSASAAAYAARAGLLCAVVIPEGQIALGKLAQALIHGARRRAGPRQLRPRARDRARAGGAPGVEVVNSVNPVRIEGQKTAAFEIVDVLGDAPDRPLDPGRQRRATSPRTGAATPSTPGSGRATPLAADARLAGCGCGADRARRAGAAPGDDRDRDPDRQPGVVAGRDRRPRPVGRPHRRRHRRADPRGLPAAGGRRGLLRRAGVGRVGRRPAAGRGRRAARARRHRRLHRHRPRAEGSATGDRRGAGRRRRSTPTPDASRRRWTSRESPALVTGASAGIGRAFAEGLARHGVTTSCSSPATARVSPTSPAELAA